MLKIGDIVKALTPKTAKGFKGVIKEVQDNNKYLVYLPGWKKNAKNDYKIFSDNQLALIGGSENIIVDLEEE